MNNEEIIEKYIGHIRKVSESDDEEIRSVIERLIENDPESLEALEKFLSKMDRIIPIEVEAETIHEEEEFDDKEHNEKGDIVNMFSNIDDAMPIEDIANELDDLGYQHPGEIISRLMENILYIDDIEDDGSIYVALTRTGENLWKENNIGSDK